MKNKLINTLAFVGIALISTACSQNTQSQVQQPNETPDKPWSVRMVESEMARWPESWQLDFQPKLKWDYCHGLELQAMLDVYDRYGDDKIYEYALAYADTMVNADGTIKMYKREEFSLDRVNSGKFLFRIYEQTKDEKYKKALALMRSSLKTIRETKTAVSGTKRSILIKYGWMVFTWELLSMPNMRSETMKSGFIRISSTSS